LSFPRRREPTFARLSEQPGYRLPVANRRARRGRRERRTDWEAATVNWELLFNREPRERPSAAFGRNQNLSSRQDAKGAKKTGAKTLPDLGDLGVFARDTILSLPTIYVSRPENFAQENKISTSSSAKKQGRTL
jgi:hypothetical protein